MPRTIGLTGDPPPSQGAREVTQQSGQPNAITRRPTDEPGLNPALGGGAEVRICNPCVPDPNNEPPPQRGRQQNLLNSRHVPVFGPQGFDPLANDDIFSSSSTSVGGPNPRAPRHLWPGARPDRAPLAERNHSGPGFGPYNLTYSSIGTYPPNSDPSSPSFQGRNFDNNDIAGAGSSRVAGGQGSSSPMARNSNHPTGGRAGRPMSLEGPLPPPPRFAPTSSPDRRGVNYNPHNVSFVRYDSGASSPSMIPPRGTPPSYTPQGPSSSAPTRGSHHGPTRHYRPAPPVGSAYPPRIRSMLDVDDTEPTDPPPPRPVLREEDYCPICQGVLPPPRPDGNEEAREAHIEDCIQVSFYGSHRSTPTTVAAQQQSPNTGSASSSSQAPASTLISSTEGGSVRPRRGTVGRMVTYLATEKDCVGEGGEGIAECAICFEDIEVGVEMARLECLCKFHKTCVQKWWDTKGPGACPVHQDNGF